MARVTVHIPTPLQPYADGHREIALEADSIHGLLEALAAEHEPLVTRIRTRDGVLRPYVNIFVRRTDIRELDGLATQLVDGDEVIIMPSVAGG